MKPPSLALWEHLLCHLPARSAAPGQASLIVRMTKDQKKVRKGKRRRRDERAIKSQIVCTNFIIKNRLLII